LIVRHPQLTAHAHTIAVGQWNAKRIHQKEAMMTNAIVRANAIITVSRYEPVAYEEPVAGPALSRIHVEESFRGDIEADGVVEFLQAAQADGTASFVGIERVTGAIAGRSGTFLLQDSGTVSGGIVSGDWFVVPGSGTGELAGLRGTGGFRANLGEGAEVTLDYYFD
jgi:Protein of unknown function (DUF3224)